MFSVVNHITLTGPLPAELGERMQDELMVRARDVPGFVAAYCTQPAPEEIVMIVLTDTAEAMQVVHDTVGTPWIGANLGPVIATTDRKPGPVIAHA